MDEETGKNQSPVSLLWPRDVQITDREVGRQLDTQTIVDLGIDKLLNHIFPNRWERASQEPFFTRLIDDPRVLSFRQGVLSDIMSVPDVHQRLEEAAQHLLFSRQVPTPGKADKSPLSAVARKVTQLEGYLTGVQLLESILQESADRFTTQGFTQITEQLSAARKNPLFTRLETQLPAISRQLRSVKSITIGVNLDSYLRPISAALTEIHDKPIPEARPGMFGRLLGGDSSGPAALASFHPPTATLGTNRQNPLLVPILQDVNQVMEKTARTLISDLQPFQNLQGGFFEPLGRELIFYLRLASYLREFQSLGLPFCAPEFAPQDQMLLQARGCWNLRLAELFRHDVAAGEYQNITQRLVSNELFFDQAHRGFVLTGPNRGGKTVYLQSIGILVVLAHIGALVPAETCRLSPVDGIFTHYQIEERPEAQAGRLGEESMRVRELFSTIGPKSLILMNESFASTSPGEAGILLRDILEVLAEAGIRCIVATHLHSLASEIAAEHPSIGSLISVVVEEASADPNSVHSPSGQESLTNRQTTQGPLTTQDSIQEAGQRTYKIILAPPTGKSYALDVARNYGIDRESLEKLISQRLG